MAIKKYHVSLNLLDYQNFQNDTNLDQYTGLPATGQTTYKRIATVVPIDVSNYTTVTLTYNSNYTDVNFLYSLFKNSSLIERTASKNSGDTIDVSNADQLYVCLYKYMENLTVNDFSNVMLNAGSTALPYEPYGNSFKDWFYRKYGTETETFSTLPHEVIGDGTALSAWSMKGNMQQSGTPTPSNPIYPTECGDKTANLLDYTKSETGGIDASGNYLDSPFLWRSTVYIAIDNTENYTISFEQITNLSKVRVNYYQADKTHISRQEIDALTVDNAQLSIPNNAAFIKWTLYSTASINISFVASLKIMLNLGSTALPYEPYGYKIPISSGNATTPVYISAPLRKSLDGTVFDILDSTGLVTYNVDEYGAPLVTPTTATVTVPTITSALGRTVISFGTSIQPSEFDMTYHGWHSHIPSIRSNNAWS